MFGVSVGDCVGECVCSCMFVGRSKNVCRQPCEAVFVYGGVFKCCVYR